MKYTLIVLVLLTNTFSYKRNADNTKDKCRCDDKNIVVTGKDGKKLIEWSNRKYINWDCFQGKHPPEKFKDYAAVSFTYRLWDKFTVYDDSITFDLKTCFAIDSSWVDTKKQNNNLLNHEIRHLDLAEINTRTMRKELKSYISKNKEETKYYFDYLANTKYSKSQQAFMDKYDLETNHGIDSTAQQYWNKKIDSLLNVYKEYSNPHIVIKKTWK